MYALCTMYTVHMPISRWIPTSIYKLRNFILCALLSPSHYLIVARFESFHWNLRTLVYFHLVAFIDQVLNEGFNFKILANSWSNWIGGHFSPYDDHHCSEASGFCSVWYIWFARNRIYIRIFFLILIKKFWLLPVD